LLKPYEKAVDYLFLEWIRCTSNVSATFRQELGEIIWTQVRLVACGNYGFFQVAHFIRDRQAGVAGIKEMHLSLSITHSVGWYEEYGPYGAMFESSCQTLANHLRLEVLEVLLSADQANLTDVVSENESCLFLVATRKLHVSKTFKVSLCVNLSWESLEQEEKLGKAWEPKITDFMLPDML
jgi:hypothetical protein